MDRRASEPETSLSTCACVGPQGTVCGVVEGANERELLRRVTGRGGPLRRRVRNERGELLRHPRSPLPVPTDLGLGCYG